MRAPRSHPLRISPVALFVFLPCAFLGLSCSKGLQSVSGKVLHKGQPIKGAAVTLHPKGGDQIKAQKPSGLTGEDGSFTLYTGKEPGAAPGEYVVTVLWLQQPPAPAGGKIKGTDPPPDPIDQFQGRYADHTTSKISVTVKSGMSQLEPIKLD